jgi:Ser/Thr protein kinase RdoA (MazF antagonist)
VSPHGHIFDLIASLIPGSRVIEVTPLAPDSTSNQDDGTAKAVGYGLPLRIRIAHPNGAQQSLVFRTASANDFGHDRRSDRAQGMLLSFDTFSRIPRHIQAVDVGAVVDGGRLVSLRAAGELYLLTTYAPGSMYADDLRRIARDATATPLDFERCNALARFLIELHSETRGRPAVYTRALRDLVGHGEGIFGVIDGYPHDVPSASPQRLRAIERSCVEWRWHLRDQPDRLVRTHGDYHPFNVVFDQGAQFTLLDASRGCAGDRADDVTCMAVNFIFFALDHPRAWHSGLGLLWRRFWNTYLEVTPDRALLAACPPFLAWRALVVANPVFYPAMTPGARDRLLGFTERALAAQTLDPSWAEDLFA